MAWNTSITKNTKLALADDEKKKKQLTADAAKAAAANASSGTSASKKTNNSGGTSASGWSGSVTQRTDKSIGKGKSASGADSKKTVKSAASDSAWSKSVTDKGTRFVPSAVQSGGGTRSLKDALPNTTERKRFVPSQTLAARKSSGTQGRHFVPSGNIPTEIKSGANATVEKKPGFGKWLVDNIMNGIGQFNKGVINTVDFILPTAKDFGGYSVADKFFDYMRGTENELESAASETNKIKGRKWETAGNVTSMLTAALPNTVLAMMSGGTSAGVSTIESTASSGMGQTLLNSSRQLAKNPMFWTSFAQTAGNTYDDAKAEGANDVEATATAMISSLINAGVEIGGGVETIPNNPRSITNWVKGMFDEGKEEVVQGIVEQAVKRIAYDYDKPVASLTDENAVINPYRAAQEFGGGAIVGGVLGAGQMAAGAAVDAYDNTVGTGRFIKGIGAEGEVVDDGLKRDAATAAYRYAQNLQAKQNKGKNLSDWNVGRQFQKNEKAWNAEQSLINSLSKNTGVEINTEDDLPGKNGQYTPATETETKYSQIGTTDDGLKIYKTNYPANTPKSVKQNDIIGLVQNVWSKNPITMTIQENGAERQITAQFDPTLGDRSDLAKIAFGNRKGSGSDRRITLDLSSDLYQIAEDAEYAGSKAETGKNTAAHEGVKQWHYFVTDMVYEAENGERTKGHVSIDVKQNDDGNYFYSFAFEKGAAPQTLLAAVSEGNSPTTPTNNSIHNSEGNVNSSGKNFIPRGGRIDISRDADTSIPATAGHELTHAMRANAPEAYSALESYILQSVKTTNSESLTKRINTLKNKYGYSDEVAREEVAAEIAEKYLGKKSGVDDIINNNPTLADKILSGIKSAKAAVQDKLKSPYKNRTGLEMTYKQLNESEKLWNEALRQMSENNGAAAETNENKGNVKYSVKENEAQIHSENFKKWFGDWENNPENASKVVNEDGTPKVVYHGTGDFGFTVFDTSKSDDKTTLFFTDDADTASTYSGIGGKRTLGDNVTQNVDNMSPIELTEALNSLKDADDHFMNVSYDYYDLAAVNNLIKSVNDGKDDLLSYLNGIDLSGENETTKKYVKKLQESIENNRYQETSTPLYWLLHYSDVFRGTEKEKTFARLEADMRLLPKLLNFGETDIIVAGDDEGYSRELYSIDDARNRLREKQAKGNYEVYLNLKKPLIVACEGRNWNDIDFTEGNKTLSTTREIAEYAKNSGYDGAIFTDIKDNGGRNLSIDKTKSSNVYVAFNSEQVKSATDNVGTFDKNNADIRYSLKEDAGMDLSSKECQERFAENVDKVFSGEMPQRTVINIGDTPKLLQKYGASDVPVTINQSVMYKIAYPTGYFGAEKQGHNLGIPALKQLPKQISNPAAILKSTSQDNSLVLLTEWEDTKGNPVIIPLQLDKDGIIGITNEISSAYGKQNFDALLTDHDGNSTVLYTKNNEGIHQILQTRLQLPGVVSDDIHQLTQSGLQLPGASTDDTLVNNSIHNSEGNVKNSVKENADGEETDSGEVRRSGDKVSKLYTNTMQKDTFTDEFKSEAERREPEFMYEGITNKETYETAQKELEDRGADALIAELSRTDKEWSADDVGRTLALMTKYQSEGDTERAVDIASIAREKATRAGQASQAWKIANKLTPEGQFIDFVRKCDDMVEEQIKKHPAENEIRKEIKKAKERDRQREKRRKVSRSKASEKSIEYIKKRTGIDTTGYNTVIDLDTADIDSSIDEETIQFILDNLENDDCGEWIDNTDGEIHFEPNKRYSVKETSDENQEILKRLIKKGGVNYIAEYTVDTETGEKRIISIKPANQQTAKTPVFKGNNQKAADGKKAADKGETAAETKTTQSGGERRKRTQETRTKSPEKIIKEYEAAVDENMELFIERVRKGENKKYEYRIGRTTNRFNSAIKNGLGIDISGFTHCLAPDAVEHIDNRQGINGEHDKSMSDMEDIQRIGYVLDNFDHVYKTDTVSNKYKDKNNNPAPIVIMIKRIDGHYVIAEAVPDSQNKQVHIVSAYKNKATANKNEAEEVPRDLLKSLGLTSENELLPTSKDNVSQNKEKVKSETAKKEDAPKKERAKKEKPKKSDLEKVLDKYHIKHLSEEEIKKANETLKTLDGLNDKNDLINLILKQSKERKTASWKLVKHSLEKQDITFLKDTAKMQVFGKITDSIPSTFASKLSTYQAMSHLLNAKTMARNILSNMTFNSVDRFATDIGALVDKGIGLFTKQRTVGLDKGIFEKGTKTAKFQGATQEYLDIALAVNHDKGSSKYDLENTAKRTFRGKTFGTLERAMSYGLQATDAWTKSGIEHNVRESLKRVKNCAFTEEEINEIAEYEARYRTFQDDTALSQMLKGIKDALNCIGLGKKGQGRFKRTHEFGAGDLVQKYTQVPGALITRSVEFSPLGYCKFVYNLGQAAHSKYKGGKFFSAKTQRNLALTFARATTGSGFIALFTLLSKLGIFIGEREDEDKEKKAFLNAEGISNMQINWSAFGRLIGSGFKDAGGMQDGDVLMSLGFLEPLNTEMAIGYNIANMEGGIKKPKNWANATTAKTFDQIMDMSTMSTIRSISNTLSYGGDGSDVAWGVVADSATGFIPAPARQLGSFLDTTQRNPYYEENTQDKAKERFKASVPWARESVAAKINPYGEEKTTSTGNRFGDFVNNFISPGYVSIYQTSDISGELHRLSDISTDILPHVPTRSFTGADGEEYKLYGKDYEKYSKLVGTITTDKMRDIINSDSYKDMTDDRRVELLKDAADDGESEAQLKYVLGDDYEVSTLPTKVKNELARLSEYYDNITFDEETGKTYVWYDDEKYKYELTTEQAAKYLQETDTRVNDYQTRIINNEKIEDVLGEVKMNLYADEMTQEQYDATVAKLEAETHKNFRSEKSRQEKLDSLNNFVNGDSTKQVTVTGSYNDLADAVKQKVINKSKTVAVNEVQAEMEEDIKANGTLVYTRPSHARNKNTDAAEETASAAEPVNVSSNVQFKAGGTSKKSSGGGTLKKSSGGGSSKKSSGGGTSAARSSGYSSSYTPYAAKTTAAAATPRFRATDTSGVPKTVTYNGNRYSLTTAQMTRYARRFDDLESKYKSRLTDGNYEVSDVISGYENGVRYSELAEAEKERVLAAVKNLAARDTEKEMEEDIKKNGQIRFTATA